MYAWLWRRLPGPVGAKAAQAVVLAVAAAVACFLWAFPAVAGALPFNQQTVEEQP